MVAAVVPASNVTATVSLNQSNLKLHEAVKGLGSLFTAAGAGYMLSFSEAILEDVVRRCQSLFLLVFHNIVLWVNKPLTSHEKVTDNIWSCFLLDKKKTKEIRFCGINQKEQHLQKKTSLAFLEKNVTLQKKLFFKLSFFLSCSENTKG